MASARVVNIRTDKYDLYIGRPSVWGNPFVIGRDGDRDEVIKLYKSWILCQDDLLDRLPELIGKTLGCFCKPEACHGDVLVDLVNRLVGV